MFYTASYAAMNVGAFAVVSHFAGAGERYVTLEDYAGLGRRSPLLAATLTIFLLSLIGIPMTGGFFAKFYVFSAALQANLVWTHHHRRAQQRRRRLLLPAHHRGDVYARGAGRSPGRADFLWAGCGAHDQYARDALSRTSSESRSADCTTLRAGFADTTIRREHRAKPATRAGFRALNFHSEKSKSAFDKHTEPRASCVH